MSKQEKQSEPNPEKTGKTKARAKSYMKYSGMAFQMGIIIALGAYGGQKLDEYFQTDKPYITVICSLFAIFIALYSTLKDFFVKEK